jgi:hypothetical protein
MKSMQIKNTIAVNRKPFERNRKYLRRKQMNQLSSAFTKPWMESEHTRIKMSISRCPICHSISEMLDISFPQRILQPSSSNVRTISMLQTKVTWGLLFVNIDQGDVFRSQSIKVLFTVRRVSKICYVIQEIILNIIFKHPVVFIYLSRTIYSVLNATIFTFIFPPYDMFRPQAASIRCFVYIKTVALYKMFTYLYTCKCDVSFLIYLIYTRCLYALISLTF